LQSAQENKKISDLHPVIILLGVGKEKISDLHSARDRFSRYFIKCHQTVAYSLSLEPDHYRKVTLLHTELWFLMVEQPPSMDSPHSKVRSASKTQRDNSFHSRKMEF
jgi:hypothetical protein